MRNADSAEELPQQKIDELLKWLKWKGGERPRGAEMRNLHDASKCGGSGICLTCSIAAATTSMADVSAEEDE